MSKMKKGGNALAAHVNENCGKDNSNRERISLWPDKVNLVAAKLAAAFHPLN